MTKGFVALLALLIAILAVAPSSTVSGHSGLQSTIEPTDVQTRVLQDTVGNVHVLWLVPARNNSASGPGIWYSKYSPNGTDTIPPTKITNSTGIQSADLAVDEHGNAVIVWADDITTPSPAYSVLNLLRFNSTRPEMSRVLEKRGSLILWPSLALGKNDSIYLTWTAYNPSNFQASVEYGRLTPAGSIETEQLASYPEADAFPPQTNVVFDNSSQYLQVAWGASQRDHESASTVNYAKLDANGTILIRLQIANFSATLRDVTMTGITGTDGAFVLWQTTEWNSSLYVSQISSTGELVYVKELNSTTGQYRYLSTSTDFHDHLYVFWYQPSTAEVSNSTESGATNMTYVRMNATGVIDQTGTGVFRDPIIGVTILNDGIVYGVSPEGLVRVVASNQKRYDQFAVSALALLSCVSVAGFTGSFLLEEGRYRWVTLYSRIRKRTTQRPGTATRDVLRLLARKPGLRIREIKQFAEDQRVDTMTLLGMEKGGFLASFRDGLSRRFYVKHMEAGPPDALRTRILLWVLDHPGIWEAQLAKDLALSQQIAHYHLKKLRESKLITVRLDPNGHRKLYRFADSGSDNRG